MRRGAGAAWWWGGGECNRTNSGIDHHTRTFKVSTLLLPAGDLHVRPRPSLTTPSGGPDTAGRYRGKAHGEGQGGRRKTTGKVKGRRQKEYVCVNREHCVKAECNEE